MHCQLLCTCFVVGVPQSVEGQGAVAAMSQEYHLASRRLVLLRFHSIPFPREGVTACGCSARGWVALAPGVGGARQACSCSFLQAQQSNASFDALVG